MDWCCYCHLVIIHIDLKNAKCYKKLFHYCTENYLYMHKCSYIIIRNLSVLGYVSRTRQPVIRISIFMLMMD